jgi:hypothetical protein
MSDSQSFSVAILLGKSRSVDFWICSVEEVALHDPADVSFCVFGVEYEHWSGSVGEVIPFSVHGRQFWMAKLNVAYTPPPRVTPTPTSSDDLINVSVTITSSSGSYKYVRQHLPAIVKN